MSQAFLLQGFVAVVVVVVSAVSVVEVVVGNTLEFFFSFELMFRGVPMILLTKNLII